MRTWGPSKAFDPDFSVRHQRFADKLLAFQRRRGFTDDHVERLRRELERGPYQRGTPEWDQRERLRMALGCRCLSFGAINAGDGKVA